MRRDIFHQLIPVAAAAAHVKNTVEFLVKREDLRLLSAFNIHMPERHVLPQVVNIFLRKREDSHTRNFGFEYRAQVADFFDQLRVDQADIGSDLRPDLNEPPLGKLELRFPERCAADAQPLAKLRLVQFLSGFKPCIHDIVCQNPENIIFRGFMFLSLCCHLLVSSRVNCLHAHLTHRLFYRNALLDSLQYILE